MTQRKAVFQSKVLQKLYPAAPTLVTEDGPAGTVEARATKTHVKRESPGEGTAFGKITAFGDAGKTESAADPGRRMYTALPPPADYRKHPEESVGPPQLESINSAEDPAAESSEEPDQEEEAEEQKRRRRRRKRKSALHQVSEKDGEPGAGQSGTPVDEGGERISKNKKRKLKKKRHKEKLLSMGLITRAAALEFTYRKEEEEEQEEEEEEEEEEGAAQVSDFLKTTMEIYMSDSSVHVKVPRLSAAVDDLLGSIASGSKPNSVLKQLHSLKAFVQHKDTQKLEKALKELNDNTSMSAEETTAVVSLFQYWITDILPMQRDEKTTATPP